MKINIPLLIGLIAIIAFWTIQSENFKPSESIEPRQAPDFLYQTLDGTSGNLRDHQGKVVLLHFWASWCPPCIIEFPALLDLAESQTDFILLAISTDDKKEDIRKFLKRLKRSVPDNVILAQDVDKSISEGLYGTIKLPESFLITPSMDLAEKITGPQDNWNSALWRNKISILNGE